MSCTYALHHSIQASHIYLTIIKDQLVTSTASKELEVEVVRLQNENADLKRKVADFSVVESAKKRTEDKLEALEKRVRFIPLMNAYMANGDEDGRCDTRKGSTERKRVERYI